MNDMKNVIIRISKLTSKEKVHILNILKNHGIDFTKNTNGYFFNLSTLDDDIILKLNKCLELIEKNRDLIKEMDKRREELLHYYKTLIENTLHITLGEKRNEYINYLKINPSKSNLSIRINRVKIKRKKLFDNIDPDVLMKDYIISRKYQKTSVYYRLILKVKHSRSRLQNNNEEVEEFKADYDNTSEYDAEDAIEDAIEDVNEDVNDDIEDYIDIEVKDENELENDVENDNSDNEFDDEDYSDIDIENEGDDTDIKTDIKTIDIKLDARKLKSEQTILDMSFYKNLLYKQGFSFNENSKCHLTYQDYIT